MDNEQQTKLTKEMGIATEHVLREEAEMRFLHELSQDKLGAKVAFYGGTAMRLAYQSPRFSEDIDLITLKPVLFSEFKKFIQTVLTKNTAWELRDMKDKRQTMFAFILIKDSGLKHNFSIKIEVHKPTKKINLDCKLSLLKSPTSIFEPLLLVPTLEELKKLKEAALLDREKPRDIFDLWFIAQTLRTPFILPDKITHYTQHEFKNELQKFLPRKFYVVITQLYEQLTETNKTNT